MKICRYSYTGFTPVYQQFMKDQVDYLLSFEEDNCGLVDHIRDMVSLGVRSRLVGFNPQFSFRGIHVFFLPVRDKDVRLLLNHLDDVPPYHEMELDDCTPAHHICDPFSSPLTSLIDLKENGHIGAYIPF